MGSISAAKRSTDPPSRQYDAFAGRGEAKLSRISETPTTGSDMAKKVCINGFGRIGRNFYRAYLEKSPGFEIVAVNDLADPDVLAHVLKYDSSHGVLDAEIVASAGQISVDGNSFEVLSERDPGALPWA